jgi:hypothetical protein
MKERTTNTNTEATVTAGVTLITNLATVLSVSNTLRIYFSVTTTDEPVWIRFIPAATDNAVRKGIFLPTNATYEMPSDNIYTGEISVINVKNGKNPITYATEF